MYIYISLYELTFAFVWDVSEHMTLFVLLH